MKKIILLIAALSITGTSFGQLNLGKLFKKGEAKEKTSESGGFPKGIEVYNTSHTDETGISGTYHMLYPVYLEANRKGFELNQVTIEYRKESYNGVLHWINDEQSKGLRYTDADLTTLADFVPAADGKIGVKIIDKFNNYSFNVKNSNQFKSGTQKPQSFKDGAKFIRYSQDPDIIIVSSARIFESQGCVPVYKAGDTYDALKMDSRYAFGQQFNLLVKDPKKLEGWDSTRLINAALEASVRTCTDCQASMADVFELPKRSHTDATLEGELAGRVKSMAATDKPISWKEKFSFLYMHRDWKVVYADHTKTTPLYRTCIAVAVSKGWEQGECRYIAVHVKQNWTGSDYGAKEVGFGGSLIPVSNEKVKAFK